MADDKKNFALPKKNLLWIAIGFAIMVLGYILLAGGGSKDPSVFSPGIFSVKRLYIAPVVMLLGCGVVVFAIMHRNKKETEK
ncbi:MAG: DUF3098 domain-containing protein [Bacteroidales bacterium]|nr:DUF3098 domain-containing protein [Bacteroidales bacterium]MBP5518241.1 DUF3098 domain-containing protein [Bacteroidales bacterium]